MDIRLQHSPDLFWTRASEVASSARGLTVLLGASPSTEKLRLQVRRMGPHFRTALITGERGVKKEEVARALHAASPAAHGPFVICDSARVDGLLQDEQVDLLRQAGGGTIFVRELGQFSAAAQGKLIVLLNTVESVGGERVRVITSVSEDVDELLADGKLRAEIQARIGTIELRVAPLRERVGDIEAIALALLDEAAAEFGIPGAKISGEALGELKRREWPGNERELDSALRMALLASGGGVVEERHLPKATQAAGPADVKDELGLSMKLQDVVDAHVHDVLRRCEGNKLRAAEALGISRSTLYRMLDAAESAS